jgi:hypothetical protein
MSKEVLAWHFVGDALRDRRPVPADNVTLKHKGKLELCASGLHASERLIDALQYAPGPILCRVQMGGTIKKGSDKLVARQRTILWRVDSMDILRKFARQCALDVAHLWNMPPVVRQYLETGDESIRDAAWDAAWTSAWDADSDAARAAASASARAVAWASARAAARAAASDAARASAWDAAWDAARDAQNTRLTEMVIALAPEGS